MDFTIDQKNYNEYFAKKDSIEKVSANAYLRYDTNKYEIPLKIWF